MQVSKWHWVPQLGWILNESSSISIELWTCNQAIQTQSVTRSLFLANVFVKPGWITSLRYSGVKLDEIDEIRISGWNIKNRVFQKLQYLNHKNPQCALLFYKHSLYIYSLGQPPYAYHFSNLSFLMIWVLH